MIIIKRNLMQKIHNNNTSSIKPLEPSWNHHFGRDFVPSSVQPTKKGLWRLLAALSWVCGALGIYFLLQALFG